MRSLTPDLYNRVSSSIKRSRITPAFTSASTYETPPPQSVASTIDSAESVIIYYNDRFILYLFILSRRALEIALLLKEHPDCTCVLVTLIQEYQSRFVCFYCLELN